MAEIWEINMATIVKTTFQVKRASAKRWEELNFLLAAGEPGYELDTGKLKVGNGVTPWKELPYIGEVELPAADSSILIATILDDVITLKTSARFYDKNNEYILENDETEIVLAKIAKTGSIYDIIDNTSQDDDRYIILNGGTAFTVI